MRARFSHNAAGFSNWRRPCDAAAGRISAPHLRAVAAADDVFATAPPRPYTAPLPQQQNVLAVVSVMGKDQKGVVAQFATYMADRGINIEDLSQGVHYGFFVMDAIYEIEKIAFKQVCNPIL